jgi:hypothetical protein
VCQNALRAFAGVDARSSGVDAGRTSVRNTEWPTVGSTIGSALIERRRLNAGSTPTQHRQNEQYHPATSRRKALNHSENPPRSGRTSCGSGIAKAITPSQTGCFLFFRSLKTRRPTASVTLEFRGLHSVARRLAVLDARPLRS